jgi:broad specificity phosphatase PhoE
MNERTIVHLLRHGEVHNPEKILYGRLPGYNLSEVGRKMADRAAEYFAARDVAAVIASPLERAQQTAAPVAAAHNLPVATDERIIESTSVFEGRAFGPDLKVLKHPRSWRHLRNPVRPSWGEAYAVIAIRMHAAAAAARDAVRGREAVLVSHQLPIWIARLAAEHRRLWHDPRRRECSLASVTSFTYEGDHLVSVDYTEPAADLLPIADTEERGA